MKIAMVASGSRGDVQPYIALGKGLKAAGNDVRLLTSDDFEGLANSANLEFRSTGTSVESIIQSEEWQKTLEGGNFLAILSRMRTEMSRQAQEQAQRLPPLLEGTDLIIAGVNGMTGVFSTAEKLGIPYIQAYVFPITPTGAFASPLAPTGNLGGILNRVSFHAMQQMLWQSFRVSEVATRRVLGMSPPSPLGPFRALKRNRVPILYGYSKHVLPQPSDWADFAHVTGYWFLDTESAWTPPSDLTDFLNAGSPPVYIGFGSMGSRNPEATTQLALKALSLAGVRGVLASGWGGLRQSDLPDTVHMLTSVPHSWLFPHMTAVVHHGGAGTTAAGLRAGVPSIVVPFFGDQSFWGRRVAALGVGTAPIPRRRLTAEGLAEAIQQAVSNSDVRQRAASLGEKIRAEDGIEEAVAVINKFSEALRVTRRSLIVGAS